MATGVGIDPARIAQLTEREEAHLNAETSGSARMYERSRKVMPIGVPSSYQVRAPHPIFLERGSARRSGTSTAPSTATSTTASARWCRATRTPRSRAP